MKIYRNNEDTDTWLREDQLIQALKDDIGIAITPYGENNKYSKEQKTYIEALLEIYITENCHEFDVEELVEEEEFDVLDELNIDYSIPEYREQEGLYHNFFEGGREYEN